MFAPLALALVCLDSAGATSPLATTDLLRSAWTHFHDHRSGDARDAFRRALAAPDVSSEQRVQGWFGLGLALGYGSPLPDLPGAIDALGHVIALAPEADTAAWAHIELGNFAMDRNRADNAVAAAHYARVVERFSHTPAVHEAALKLASIHFLTGTRESIARGVDLLEQHLRQHPDNPLAVVMHFRLDYTYCVLLQDYENSLRHAKIVAERRLGDPFRWSRQLWHTAEMLRRYRRDYAGAVHYYRRIVAETPRSEHVWEARQRIAEYEAAISGQAP